jgi:sugar phosphate isomerase/epimerase
MVPALLESRSPVLGMHSLVGCSTGYIERERGDWPRLVQAAAEVSSLAVELSAISESELDGLQIYLRAAPRLPFRYVSVHGPSKDRVLSEPDLVQRLGALPGWVDGIVMHPDTFEDASVYRPLGRRLLLENMDDRKRDGRTAGELERFFKALPEAGLCFDIAHAKSVDETMGEGRMILERYANRLRHVHLSSLDLNGHHVSLTVEDQRRFWPLLKNSRDVPWILEAPPPS